jgi:tetratricopeptide (TPR) repeat protein
VDKAAAEWQEAVRLEPGNARAWRNLGLALARQGREALPRALECYEKAARLLPRDSRILLELDEIRERQGVSGRQRLEALQRQRETVVERDELVARLVDLLIAEGDHAGALEYLDRHHFNTWEGSYGIHNAYIEAHVGVAERSSDPREALAHYLKACEYPMNLEVAPREPNLRGFLYYPMARLYSKIGDNTEARRLLEVTAGESTEYPTLATFYQALALRDLGREGDAARLLSELEAEARRLIGADSQHYRRMADQDQQALGHYYLSRVLEARGQTREAQQELDAARGLEPGIAREAVMIAQRVFARAHQ